MSHISDAKRTALMTALAVSVGNIDDLEIQWLQSKGATSDQVNNAWLEVFHLGGAKIQLTGTVNVAGGSNAVVGTGTLFTTELKVGDAIQIGTETHFVTAITDDLNLTLEGNYASGSGGNYVLVILNWNDAAFAYLGGLGHTGSLPDRWKSFWDGALP